MQNCAQLIDWVREARQRTCELVADLTDGQLIGPRLPTINPLLWELGHIAWFQEKWVLRRRPDYAVIRPDVDSLYDSSTVAHATRWDLPLPGREQTLDYLTTTRDRIMDWLGRPGLTREDIYFTILTVYHEDMHAEAFTYTRQTLGYPAPQFSSAARQNDRETALQATERCNRPTVSGSNYREDVDILGGVFHLGAAPDEAFVFDNEKWAHPVELGPFAIARLPVTQADFAAFVDDGSYRQDGFWSEEGRRWRTEAGATQPLYWQSESPGRWLRRDFDQWVPLEPDRPMVHVNWYEAQAYASWSGRRLPSEAQWEAAASMAPGPAGFLPGSKRRFPWGDEAPAPGHANLDWRAMGCIDVDRLPDGDSAVGCRQMIGNVWEWTASLFLPYPGFVPDAYKEYSQPWFGTHKVLRGGCWATRGRLVRNTWRNFYRPDRRDVWAGFRTCPLNT
jgi:iron(II)-dependent oxidoreductase